MSAENPVCASHPGSLSADVTPLKGGTSRPQSHLYERHTVSRDVNLTSADRVLFPDDGITKGDLFSYYGDVADAIVPHLRDRPFTMKRYREGIAREGFFQKQAPKGMPG